MTNDAHVAGGRQARASRFGSTASSGSSGHGASVDREKKKGFLGGFLKRKTGASVAARSGGKFWTVTDTDARLHGGL
jgi:hypothetical protein